MAEYRGWLLDLYADPVLGLALWLLGEDGQRRCFAQSFPVSFYASGPDARLRALWRFVQSQPFAAQLERRERRELFQGAPLTVLRVQVEKPHEQPALFARVSEAFPELTYFDADLKLPLRHAAAYGTFPLARCRVEAGEDGCITAIEALEVPWELDPPAAPLRILSIEPDCDPHRSPPAALHLDCEGVRYRLALEPPRPLLVNLGAILRRHDPDVLLTAWGDTWLLPLLLAMAKSTGVPLPLNRHSSRPVVHRKQHSYFSYGQVIYMGPQVHLLGRWHVDVYNAMLFHDYALDGVLEMSRVSALPVQIAARSSPGSGISAMQIVTALRQEILVPWHKQQPEDFKGADDLLRADQGGLVYQPLIGLHQDVAEIDFISMYPSIMVHFNISPETTGARPRPGAQRVPALDLWIDDARTGLVPETLAPLLNKRITLKGRLAELPAWDPRRKHYQAQASAHKWLLVTCFGYLGYKNARFGRIEAHEAVTAYGREALLRAKEAAEDLGFTVIHLYVDGMWVRKEGCARVPDFQPLLEEILERTGLPVALDGIYRWVAFLPSRLNARVPVPNRYFGVFQDGSLKMRGIETRRRDTPAFVAQTQLQVLELLAQAPDANHLAETLPAIDRLLRRKVAALRSGKIDLQDLLATQKLSRRLAEYRTPSPVARAVAQLEELDKTIEPGEHVRFLYLRGKPGVHAWNLGTLPDPQALDVNYYIELLVRAISTVLQPLGVEESRLRHWVHANAGYGAPPGFLPPPEMRSLPLLAQRNSLVSLPA